ncbi:N-acetylmuramoyl-L-alanine amidase, partial [Geodermatophilus sp. SYSU D00815]
MRRVLAGLVAFLVLTATLIVITVVAGPEAEPIPTSIDEVELGSVDSPAPEAVVSTGEDPAPSEPPSSGAAAPTSSAATGTAGTDAAGAGGAGTDDVPVSGQELPGVPALSLSRPDTDEFSSVGVTWEQDPDVVDVRAQIRVKGTDGRWGGWTTLERDDVTQRVSAVTADHDVRDGTAPYWTGPARGIEVIVQGADGAAPRDVRVALLDPGSSPADALDATATPSDSAHAADGMPRVYTRAEWGADESIRFWDPEYPSTIKAATVHHTADSNNYTAEQVPAIMRSMYAYHTQTRGWGDIGYNVIVDKFGRIFEGRFGGLTSTVVGAHAGGFNTFTFGVSMLGNYDVAPVPQATINSVSEIIAWKFGLYRVDPRGTTVLTSGGGGTARYAAGVRVTLPTIFGHRDVGATACPGQYGYARLGDIRTNVSSLVGTAGRTLLRTPENSTVYVVSGTMKYPIADLATLEALGPLGPVGYVASSYLAQFTEGPRQGRVVLSPGGGVFFIDAGIKLQLTSCAQVADFGASCASLVRWEQPLIDAFVTGPVMSSVYRTTSGKAFVVSGGVKREVVDDAALAAAGWPTAGVRLLES